MSNLPEQIGQTIATRKLFRRGDKILVAVSGGVDSMVLLHLLHALSKHYGWQLTVAHLNHQLRGRSSDADQQLVLRSAKKLKLPVVVERIDVKKISETGKLSMEMAARKVRHEFLARAATRLKVRRIALAHHADDQIELFFLRLLRGSSSDGLAGMKWRNASPANPSRELIRPLLEQSKDALEAYAAAQKIPFREDATNQSLDIQRNRIRHELLPLLRQNYQPALDRVILRLMDLLGAEAEFLNKAAGVNVAHYPKATPDFAKLPIAIQRRRIQGQLLQQGIAGDFELIERLRSSAGAMFSIGPELSIQRDSGGYIHLAETNRAALKSSAIEMEINARRGKVVFEDVQIFWKNDSNKSFVLPKPSPGREVFDAEKIGSRITLRHWRAGDRFQPIGMAQSVKLQDLFTNMKIPKSRRHELIVGTTAMGELFWVEGLRISERFKLTSKTRSRLQWGWKRP